jgi:hypothetical protein
MLRKEKEQTEEPPKTHEQENTRIRHEDRTKKGKYTIKKRQEQRRDKEP